VSAKRLVHCSRWRCLSEHCTACDSDQRGRGVDSGASQKRPIEDFVFIAFFWLFVVLVLSIAVLVLAIASCS
jgi:hypothetical protein